MDCIMAVSPHLLSLDSSAPRCSTVAILTPFICLKAHCVSDPDSPCSDYSHEMGFFFSFFVCLADWNNIYHDIDMLSVVS